MWFQSCKIAYIFFKAVTAFLFFAILLVHYLFTLPFFSIIVLQNSIYVVDKDSFCSWFITSLVCSWIPFAFIFIFPIFCFFFQIMVIVEGRPFVLSLIRSFAYSYIRVISFSFNLFITFFLIGLRNHTCIFQDHDSSCSLTRFLHTQKSYRPTANTFHHKVTIFRAEEKYNILFFVVYSILQSFACVLSFIHF